MSVPYLHRESTNSLIHMLYSNAGSTVAHDYLPGTDPIHMDNVDCSGSELTLLSCNYDPNPNCDHFTDALVECQREL